MSKLTDIVDVIIGKTKSIKKEFVILSDQFIIEREVKTEQNNFKVDNSAKKVQKSNLKVEPIGNTEQLKKSIRGNILVDQSDSGMSEIANNHIKTKLCIICNEPTEGGSICSDKCFEKFEKL